MQAHKVSGTVQQSHCNTVAPWHLQRGHGIIKLCNHANSGWHVTKNFKVSFGLLHCNGPETFSFFFVNKAISNPHFNTIYVNTDEDCHFMGVKLATHTQMITTK